eukprot:CAMPEP_0175605838 /NCGR_PEP_ID=MMETSP0096-20121207/60412_1 /TAXON_ID=311494 /ORGANISM="Alexandrium monilatum, Strain CCMP3105" /LENGTH=70 /DNA_ID=CAMNT_0016910661 /DNA_START=770 /DNA_END=979 /DNA_ORIENTATION=+
MQTSGRAAAESTSMGQEDRKASDLSALSGLDEAPRVDARHEQRQGQAERGKVSLVLQKAVAARPEDVDPL